MLGALKETIGMGVKSLIALREKIITDNIHAILILGITSSIVTIFLFILNQILTIVFSQTDLLVFQRMLVAPAFTAVFVVLRWTLRRYQFPDIEIKHPHHPLLYFIYGISLFASVFILSTLIAGLLTEKHLVIAIISGLVNVGVVFIAVKVKTNIIDLTLTPGFTSTQKSRFTFVFAILTLLFSTIPLFTPKFLGSETLIDPVEIEAYNSKFQKVQLNTFHAWRNPYERVLFEKALSEVTQDPTSSGYYNFKYYISEKGVGIPIISGYLRPLCIFATYERKLNELLNMQKFTFDAGRSGNVFYGGGDPGLFSAFDFDSYKECVNSTGTLDPLPRSTIMALRTFIPYSILITISDAYETKNIALTKEDRKEIDRFRRDFTSQTVRGGYLHHYYSALHSTFADSSVLTNQYGLGPALAIKSVSKLLSIDGVTSILVLLAISHVLLLAFIYLGFRRGQYCWIIFAGFSTYVASVVFSSGLMAPMLFVFRQFPYILFALSLLLWGESANLIRNSFNSSEKKSLKNKSLSLWFIFLCVVCGFWDSTYSLLFLVSLCLFLISLTGRSCFSYARITGISYVLSILVRLIYQYAQSGPRPPIKSLSVFKYLFDYKSIGISNISFIVTIIFFVTIALVVLAISSQRAVEISGLRDKGDPTHDISKHGVIFSAILACIFMIKPMWNGSENHIGSVYLLISFVLFYFSVKPGKYRVTSLGVLFLIVCTGAIKPIPSKLYQTHRYFKELTTTENTNISGVSSVFYFSPIWKTFISDFYALNQKGDLLISPSDNALSLISGEVKMVGAPDLSTFMLGPTDLNLIDHLIRTRCKDCQRILVDKRVFWDAEAEQYDFLMNGPLEIAGAFERRRLALEPLRLLFSRLLGSGYEKVLENQSFIVLIKRS